MIVSLISLLANWKVIRFDRCENEFGNVVIISNCIILEQKEMIIFLSNYSSCNIISNHLASFDKFRDHRDRKSVV